MRRRYGSIASRVEAGDVLAVDADRAGGRLEQLQQRAADRRLAAAALADQAQRLAAPDLERHAVDRVDLARDAREHALVDREMLLQVLRPRAAARHCHRAASCRSGPVMPRLRSRRSACQQATQWPGRCCSSGGNAARHWSVAKPQRGAKLQPCGRSHQRRHHALDLVQPRARRASAARRLVEVRDRAEQARACRDGRARRTARRRRPPRPCGRHT